MDFCAKGKDEQRMDKEGNMTIAQLIAQLEKLNAKNDFNHTSIYVETDDTQSVPLKSFTLKYFDKVDEEDTDKSPVRLILEG